MAKFTVMFMGRPVGDSPREKGRIEMYATTQEEADEEILVWREVFKGDYVLGTPKPLKQ